MYTLVHTYTHIDSWVWLYVLLAVVIPTSLGFVMGVVKGALIAADLKERVGWEVSYVHISRANSGLFLCKISMY